jgi:hypothetical protein
MNQEFLTFLHLTDLRILYLNVNSEDQSKWVSREVHLPELDSLLRQFIRPEKVEEVKREVIEQVESIRDYKDNLSVVDPTKPEKNFIQRIQLKGGEGKPVKEYLRVNRDYVTEYIDSTVDPTTPGGRDGKLRIPGMIMEDNRYVLRTEAIIVDALLGQGNALDQYSQGLQDQLVNERSLKNRLMEQEIERYKKALNILTSKDKEAAALYPLVFPCCPESDTKKDKEFSVGDNI